MRINLRDAEGDRIGVIEIDSDTLQITEEKCVGLCISDIDFTDSGDTCFRVDLCENKALQKIGTRALLEEIQRRIEENVS